MTGMRELTQTKFGCSTKAGMLRCEECSLSLYLDTWIEICFSGIWDCMGTPGPVQFLHLLTRHHKLHNFSSLLRTVCFKDKGTEIFIFLWSSKDKAVKEVIFLLHKLFSLLEGPSVVPFTWQNTGFWAHKPSLCSGVCPTAQEICRSSMNVQIRALKAKKCVRWWLFDPNHWEKMAESYTRDSALELEWVLVLPNLHLFSDSEMQVSDKTLVN